MDGWLDGTAGRAPVATPAASVEPPAPHRGEVRESEAGASTVTNGRVVTPREESPEKAPSEKGWGAAITDWLGIGKGGIRLVLEGNVFLWEGTVRGAVVVELTEPLWAERLCVQVQAENDAGFPFGFLAKGVEFAIEGEDDYQEGFYPFEVPVPWHERLKAALWRDGEVYRFEDVEWTVHARLETRRFHRPSCSAPINVIAPTDALRRRLQDC